MIKRIVPSYTSPTLYFCILSYYIDLVVMVDVFHYYYIH